MSAGSIIEGAFRLVRERPAAVAVWGLLYMVAVIAMSFVMRPMIGFQAASLGNDPQAAQAMLANMSTMFARLALLEFGLLLLFIVLMTAAQRAVLRPAQPGFFYLRIGMDELRMLGLALILIILFYVGLLIAVILIAIVAGIVAVAAGGGGAAVIAIIAGLLLFPVLIWLEVRLSLAFPLTLLRHRIIIGESWRLTRGRFWSLFGAYFVIFLIVFALAMVAAMVTSGAYFAEMMRNANNPVAMQQAAQAQMARQFGAINVMTVVGWLISAVVGALTIALGGGAVATAAKELAPDQETVAETFT
jgi:hypothetical protein